MEFWLAFSDLIITVGRLIQKAWLVTTGRVDPASGHEESPIGEGSYYVSGLGQVDGGIGVLRPKGDSELAQAL